VKASAIGSLNPVATVSMTNPSGTLSWAATGFPAKSSIPINAMVCNGLANAASMKRHRDQSV
jgi:hypothetical protein